jgi:hypothetical protein
LTTYNSSSLAARSPTIVIKSDGFPMIFWRYWNSGTSLNVIASCGWNGSGWTQVTVFDISGYSTFNDAPSAVVKRSGSNIGRIWVTWAGVNAALNNIYNVYAAY